MVTDDERRDAAARLRELDYSDLQESLICAYLDALGIEGYADWVGIAHRLADLIEPEPERTCTMEYDAVHGDFVCNRCGAWVRTDASRTLSGASMKYCPYCGAKVVEK